MVRKNFFQCHSCGVPLYNGDEFRMGPITFNYLSADYVIYFIVVALTRISGLISLISFSGVASLNRVM